MLPNFWVTAPNRAFKPAEIETFIELQAAVLGPSDIPRLSNLQTPKNPKVLEPRDTVRAPNHDCRPVKHLETIGSSDSEESKNPRAPKHRPSFEP
jgi:hypothetical protein